jgi:hypothetical protein
MPTYPDAVVAERAKAAAAGDFRARVRYDLAPRAPYAFGLLAAADAAAFFGIGTVTAIEFGVADGAGLVALGTLAAEVTVHTGVVFDVVGFDTGEGLPPLRDYRDHPEIWTAGDFRTVDRAALEARLPPRTRMIWGDVADTLAPFVATLTPDAPVGFVAHDMDIYHSTVAALALYRAPATMLLPVGIAYFDDTLGRPDRIGSLLRTRWTGQLGAIEEFNDANPTRKIDVIRTLKHRRPLNQEQWLDQVYAVHVLDHPARAVGAAPRRPLTMSGYGVSRGFEWPL